MKTLPEATWITFKSVPAVIGSFVENLDPDCLDRRRSGTSWTAREHIYHIVNVQEMLLGRITLIRDSDNPVIKPFFPENEEIPLYGNMAEAMDRFRDWRRKQCDLIGELTPDELVKEARHDEYTEYNILKIINHMIFHEYWHLYRVEEIAHTKDEFFA